jgi:hypothetical protein
MFGKRNGAFMIEGAIPVDSGLSCSTMENDAHRKIGRWRFEYGETKEKSRAGLRENLLTRELSRARLADRLPNGCYPFRSQIVLNLSLSQSLS